MRKLISSLHLRTDARWAQIIALSIFLSYGIIFLQWHLQLLQFAACIAVCLLTQFAFVYHKRDYRSLLSAFITALGLCIILKADNLTAFILAAFISIASKFIIRYEGKHIFNPSNLGIAIAILFSKAWISPGQWGSGIGLIFLVGSAALLILYRVNRLDVSATFLLVYFGLEFFRSIVYKAWPLDYMTHQMSSGTILLFSLFMITDPKTSPNDRKSRIIWAIALAILAFVLGNWFYIYTAPLWALLIISPLSVILDKVFIHQKFNWI